MTPPPFKTLGDAKAWYEDWLVTKALPLWAETGVIEPVGAFAEAIDLEGRRQNGPRRARVQARQSFVFATAHQQGIFPAGLAIAERGFEAYIDRHRSGDGVFARVVDADGTVLDPTACLYEQDFSLLAMALLQQAGSTLRNWSLEANLLASRLSDYRVPAGGFIERDDHPYQANAHMHLLEAAMAWEEAGGGPQWAALTDEVVALAQTRFLDPDRGFLREFFTPEWRPADGDAGRWTEPGHQFEWAWLLERWGVRRNDSSARGAARRLFGEGLKGVNADGVAVNVVFEDGTIHDPSARLWPQTEFLKAALILGEREAALQACNGLARYLDVPTAGLWRDKLSPSGAFVDEPAPASSFYHIIVAVLELMQLAD